MIYKMPTTYVLAYFSLKLGVGGGSWGGGRGEALPFLFCLSLNGFQLLKKRVCSSRMIRSPIKSRTLLEGYQCPAKPTGSNKTCLPLTKRSKNFEVYLDTKDMQ